MQLWHKCNGSNQTRFGQTQGAVSDIAAIANITKVANTLRLDIQASLGKPNTTVLPKEHSIKMIPHDILPNSQISVLVSHYQRNFFLLYMRTNTKTHNWTTCRE